METAERETRTDYEYRTIGPPGTGKTTWITREVNRLVDEGARPIIVCYSRASVQEVTGRELPLGSDQIATLHSYCHRLLERPLIAELHIADWNEHQTERYQLNMRASRRTLDDNAADLPLGDGGERMMAELMRSRARMEPPRPFAEQFAEMWKAWKIRNKLMDYMDMVEQVLQRQMPPPEGTDIIFVDEAQDLDLLQLTLLRQWGQQAGCLVLVGDPDQTIYSWRGADPKAFVGEAIPEDHITVLNQSYRLPRAIQEKAMQWINQATDRRRVRYLPTAQEGEVDYIELTFHDKEQLVERAVSHMMDGDQVMFLTTCAYMLDPIVAELRERGVAYHNPLAATNGGWNPLVKRPNQVTASDRLTAFMGLSTEGGWNAQQLANWTALMPVKGILPRKGRELIRDLEDSDDGFVDWEDIEKVLSPEAIEAGLTGDLNWLRDNMLPSKRASIEYPLKVAQASGIGALNNRPAVVVGTIHSVKGSETDVVYLFPDLSRKGYQEWISDAEEDRNGIYRQFYVAMTRAKKKLTICQATSMLAVDLWPGEQDGVSEEDQE